MVQSLPGNKTGDTLAVISIGGNDFAGAVVNISLNPSYTQTLIKSSTDSLAKVVAHFKDAQRYTGQVQMVMFLVHDPTDTMGTIPSDVTGLSGFCLVIKPLGPFVGPGVVKQLKAYNDALAAFAKQNGILVADNYSHFLGHGYNYKNTKCSYYNAQDPTLWFYSDCMHCSDRGYHEMRRVVWKAVTGQIY
jgi:hypothetical protein